MRMSTSSLTRLLSQSYLLQPLFGRRSAQPARRLGRRSIALLIGIEMLGARESCGGVVLMVGEIAGVRMRYVLLRLPMLWMALMVWCRVLKGLGHSNRQTISLVPVTSIHIDVLSLLVALVVHGQRWRLTFGGP